jgi:hypothetical protein
LPAVSGSLLWVIAGQPLGALPAFVLNSLPIISGYSEAMSVNGPYSDIWIYLGACLLVLAVLAVCGSAIVFQRVAIAVCYAMVLFVAFKNAFVRHDAHAMVAPTALMLAATTLPLVLRRKWPAIVVVLGLALFAGTSIDENWTRITPFNFVDRIVSTYTRAWGGLAMRLSAPGRLRQKYDETFADINRRWPRPKLEGTVDMYSNHQALLVATGMPWAPRPVPQSYSAYTASLAKLNEAHLQSAKAPDNIVLQVESIDGRYPSLDDGNSWPTIINNYTYIEQKGVLVYMKKRTSPYKARPSVTVLSREASFGDRIDVPDSNEPLFAELGVSPTFAGRLLSFLYKPSSIEISVYLADGGRRIYRLISGMASAGFFLSPIVDTSGDFVLLGSPSPAKPNKLVKSFSVSITGGESICWNRRYSIRLTRPDLLRDTVIQQ